MRQVSLSTCFAFLLVGTTFGQSCPTLLWSDEFDGDALDLDTWTHDVNRQCGNPPCAWFNDELQQYYPEQAVVEDGLLKITAELTPPDSTWDYASARIVTKDKQDLRYG